MSIPQGSYSRNHHGKSLWVTLKVTPFQIHALYTYAISHPVPKDSGMSQILLGLQYVDPASWSDDTIPQRPDAKFSHVWSTHSRKVTQKSGTTDLNVHAGLLKAKTSQAAAEAIQVALIEKLSRLLAMSKEEISPERGVATYGTDSLIAVELRNWISNNLDAPIHIFELMSGWTIAELSMEIPKKSRLAPAGLFEEKE